MPVAAAKVRARTSRAHMLLLSLLSFRSSATAATVKIADPRLNSSSGRTVADQLAPRSVSHLSLSFTFCTLCPSLSRPVPSI
ncbi:hypothetical protein L6452_20895 [Arctium lappa]|uniref:Uncharacterized protein n=1 Tax=Arctium lappa TaxID=4217 RepID=A0ACB9BEJ4_ARCLA|nr:hypothetical protein L6452_20895 [Arctium lappa]